MYFQGNFYVLRQQGDTGSLVSVARLRLSFHVVDTLRYALTDVRACMFAFVCLDMQL